MSDFYSVEKIIDKRKYKGKIQYKVKWEGYSIDECTWEPLNHLENVKDLIEDYEKQNIKFLNKKHTHSNKETSSITNPPKYVNQITPTTNTTQIDPQSSQDNKVIKYLRVLSVTRELKALVEVQENSIITTKEISTKQLRELCPVILIDYYETRLKFSDK